MGDNDKIYELFRRNEHKLDEKPSRRAWERLDARLDRHDARGSTPGWLRYGGMVAAVLILVVTATMLTLNTQMENDQFAALDKSEMKESPLLDFEAKGNNDSYLKIVAYQKEYKNRGSRVTEQKMAGNLRPRGVERKKKVDTEVLPTDTDQAIASNDLIKDEMDDEILYEDVEEVITQSIVEVNKPIIEEAEDEEISPVVEKIEAEKLVAEVDVLPTEASAPVVAPGMPTPTAAPPSAVGNADYVADMSLKEEAKAAKKDRGMIEESPSYEMNTEDNSFAGMEAEEDLSLTSFEWILGSWKGNMDGSQSTEKWTRIDASTYKGKGILKAGGVTLFSEKLELKRTNVGTYLTISLDKKRVAYRMTSTEGGTFVFENRSIGYPQKIVMKKNSNKSFSMTMQNGDASSLDNKQVQYLENRNSIVGEKLIRSLKKAE